MARMASGAVDANEVLGILEWSLSAVGIAGLSIAAWLHRQQRDLERRIVRLERESEALEPIRNVLDEESLIAAHRLGKGVRR
jgi:hypothetical protein